MRYIQRCKQRQWVIYKDVNKCNDVNKGNELYTKKYIQRCKQRQWVIYKDVNKGNEMYIQICRQRQWNIYTKM